MNANTLPFLVLIAPIVLLLIAGLSRLQSGALCSGVKTSLRIASFVNLGMALVGTWLLSTQGPRESILLGDLGLGFAIRIDSLSTLMFGMIAVLSWVIFRYSIRYLEGDQRQGIFLGRMAMTVAAVQLLVLASNLATLAFAWIATSLALHQLLVFYRHRPKARMAAKKKFIMARLGDLALLVAFGMLYTATGTGQLSAIFEAATNQTMTPGLREGAAIFLVLAAIFKSAQFPTHSWLVEVMETPTPVSALLHAGLLNAGPFLIARFGLVMDTTTAGPILLIIIAAFTALFASAAYLTQPAVKTALAYSSIAHMGFSLLTCGLGVYSAAMLHMVAHSFYKAHSFLSSGSVIDQVRGHKIALPARLGSPIRLLGSLATVGAIYLGVAMALGIDPLANPALIVVGAIVMLGLSQMMSPLFDTKKSSQALFIGMGMVAAVAASFFLLEEGMHLLLAAQLPADHAPTPIIEGLMYGILAIYALVILAQTLAPIGGKNPALRTLGVHLRHGFYANAVLDKWMGALRLPFILSETPAELPMKAAPKPAPQTVKETVY